jgi:hypothetical protein
MSRAMRIAVAVAPFATLLALAAEAHAVPSDAGLKRGIRLI